MAKEVSNETLKFIVDRINLGVVNLDRNHNIVLWNKFMEINSGIFAKDILGQNLYAAFPDLPETWLRKKIDSVFLLKNFSFTSWHERPYLFKFRHNRPVTGSVDWMYQDCTFIPVKDAGGEVQFVCITLEDATDNSIIQNKLEEALNQLKQLSITDSLTGIYNRGFFEDTLANEFNRSRRYNHSFSLILFDLDNFKVINDTFGHLAGDEVLRHVSKLMKKLLRDSDVIGRYGGEEFAIILRDAEFEGSFAFAERLRDEIANHPCTYHNDVINVTVSIGITQFSQDTQRYESMIKEADAAMYASKKRGKDCVTRFHRELLIA